MRSMSGSARNSTSRTKVIEFLKRRVDPPALRSLTLSLSSGRFSSAHPHSHLRTRIGIEEIHGFERLVSLASLSLEEERKERKVASELVFDPN